MGNTTRSRGIARIPDSVNWRIYQLETFLVKRQSNRKSSREVFHLADGVGKNATICTAEGPKAVWFDSRYTHLVLNGYVRRRLQWASTDSESQIASR